MSKSQRNKLKNRALVALLIVCILGFGTGAYGLVNVGIIKGEQYKLKAQKQQLSDTTVNADRGTIYDANMNVIAKSADVWKIWINPSKMSDNATRENVAAGLSDILELDYDSVYEKCCKEKRAYIVIKSQVEYEAKTKVVEFYKANKGYNQIIGIESDVKRYYPYGTFASSILGFTGSDGIGRSGLEYFYDNTLTGTAGRVITAKNAKQVAISSDFQTSYDAEKGLNLQLTIDEVIQYYLESALQDAVERHSATYGYGIVMDTKTGAILAMSTQPDFDCNDPYKVTSERTLKEIAEIEDEDVKNDAISEARYSQWRNRTICDSYEPGSVFKCFVAAAALEEGVVSPEDSFYCTGKIQIADREYRCAKRVGHKSETFTTAFMNSCNPVFIQVGQKLGAKKFFKYFEAFGFTEQTGIDLPAESTPKANVTYYTANKLTKVSLASCSFGQTFQASPIQIITAVNAIANGGKLMQPYVVGAMLDEEGNKVVETVPTVKRQVVSEQTANTVASMMELVVKQGGGKNAYVPGFRVAGKTGTSQKLTHEGFYVASFCGFAPADKPEITVLVAIDEPRSGATHGGTVAAPVVAEVISKCMEYLNVEPQYTDEELAKLDVKTPKYVGTSVTAAKEELSAQGFTVKVNGSGDKVLAQSPAAGQIIPKNGVIVLYTDSKKKSSKTTVPDFSGLTVAQASRKAISAGLNIKVSGYTKDNTAVSYAQTIAPGTETTMGSIITVSFQTQVSNTEED